MEKERRLKMKKMLFVFLCVLLGLYRLIVILPVAFLAILLILCKKDDLAGWFTDKALFVPKGYKK